jgi:hypothetical protein
MRNLMRDRITNTAVWPIRIEFYLDAFFLDRNRSGVEYVLPRDHPQLKEIGEGERVEWRARPTSFDGVEHSLARALCNVPYRIFVRWEP